MTPQFTDGAILTQAKQKPTHNQVVDPQRQ